MPRISQLKPKSTAQQAATAIRDCPDDRLEVVKGSGKEGTMWRIRGTNASGTIPMTTHNKKNLPIAIEALVDACRTHHIRET